MCGQAPVPLAGMDGRRWPWSTMAAKGSASSRYRSTARCWRDEPTNCGRPTPCPPRRTRCSRLTWHRPDLVPDLAVRTRADGDWSDWQPVPALSDRPDASSGEGLARGSTELMWIGPSDGVQVRVGGVRPRGLTLVLLRPWAQPGDDSENASRCRGRRTVRAYDVRSRREGRRSCPARRRTADGNGAPGSRGVDGRPRYNYTIKQVHVHHTVNSNNYGRHDVPALIRGMYRYHTHYLGWSDIAYNFLVDRFGRIWIGRAGGASRPVRGAHTLGFNSTSAGIAVIGNFELVRPSDAVLDAVAAVAAWKLQPFHRNPLGTVHGLVAGQRPLPSGPSRAAADDRRTPRHQPDRLPRAPPLPPHPGDPAVASPPSSSATPRCMWSSAPPCTASRRSATRSPSDPGTYSPADAVISYVWLRDGKPIPRASFHRYIVRPADVGTRLSVRITARKAGLKPVTRRRWTKARTTGPSTVTLDARVVDGRRLRVAVRVSSPPGVRPVPHGKVVVKVDGRRDVVRPHRWPRSRDVRCQTPARRAVSHWVKARYLGDRSHDTSRAAARVRVRR